MTQHTTDVAILGSGFSGSLTALLLQKTGLRCVLVERDRHPRFAIGESSTPTANLVLRDLARTYGLTRLEPLAKYGTWQTSYPELTCGLKRGFSYFDHKPGQPFLPCDDHNNELLVTASRDDQHGDTHWLRSEVDAFLVEEVKQAGILFFDETDVSLSQESNGWRLQGTRHEGSLDLQAGFLIDATGTAGVVSQTFSLLCQTPVTNSRALYSHFVDVQSWSTQLVPQDHPFDCDWSAQHHMLDEGWMWQLRFLGGVTSAGFVLDAARHPLDPSITAEQEWHNLLRRYPALASQFQQATLASLPGKIIRTNRLQRRAKKLVGNNWALLPSTAGFIDPLHSTGIAQTLCGIERLVSALVNHWDKTSLLSELMQYKNVVQREFDLIDLLVSGCYMARSNFRILTAFTMLYFAAATSYEHRRAQHKLPSGAAMLCADDREFCQLVTNIWQRLKERFPTGKSEVVDFENAVAKAIEPYNLFGLCKPQAKNMYAYTAATDGISD